MNGGYIMIYKNSRKIYLELFACLTLGKPILWYEDKNTCFFIDTISGGEITTEIVDDEEVRTYGDIILTKGGMTITITSENVVTEVGDIQPTSGSEVTANPTLSGDEDSLTGLEVDGVKYAVSSGGGSALYQHNITAYSGQKCMTLIIINKSATLFDYNSLGAFIYGNSFTTTTNLYHINGADYSDGSNKRGYFGLYAFTASSMRIRYEDFSTGVVGDAPVGNAWTINDIVIQI